MHLQIDRKSVVQGKSVDLGGRRIIKKKKQKKKRKRKKKKKKKEETINDQEQADGTMRQEH